MRIGFKDLSSANLIIDAVYEGGTTGNLSDDVLSKLMYCENSGGFRKRGSTSPFDLKYIILFSTGDDIDWSDTIDCETGLVKYHGDNKKPGTELHDTPKKGNLVLREIFNLLSKGKRIKIPPIFMFTKDDKRDVIFRGLLVPGDSRMRPEEQLVALWSSKAGKRFQNYQAYFTILDVGHIDRQWIEDLNNGNGYKSSFAPKVWKKWIDKGVYTPLIAKKTVEYRSKDEQLPKNKNEIEIIQAIHGYFHDPHDFELCAARIAQMMDSNIIEYTITPPARDGGRDCIGKYRIGPESSGINIEFFLEAKCYSMTNSVGVKETSRLISRIKYRDFGILVTTSYVGIQAYKEIKEDKHPVIVISAIDIINILNKAGYKTKDDVLNWLEDILK